MNRRTFIWKDFGPIKERQRPETARVQGAALVIVLAFIILISGLILLFLTRIGLEQQTSTVSTAQVQIETFSRGALANIVSDIKSEILAGSTTTTVTTGSVTSTLYTPVSQLAAVPSVTAPSAGSGGLLNLLKESAYQVPFFSGSGYNGAYSTSPHPAAGVSTGAAAGATGSIGGTSLNGRYMTAARWNEHLLLPPTSTTDFTPSSTPAFALPDWVLVARDGTNPTVWNSNMIGSSNNLTNQKTVVGRYAYVIYNEGGLLDMNVAGAPSPLVPSGTTPTTLQNQTYSYKNSLALADLTQIGLTQAQIDGLVGWRNNASAYDTGGGTGSPSGEIDGSSGTAPYSWTSGQAGSYYTNWVVGNVTGFLRTDPTLPNPLASQTDQAFVNRQQLIQFVMQGLGGSSNLNLADSLQYMGTFSRGLEQPSFAPNPNRPLIVSNAPSLPSLIYSKSDVASTYDGGNNAYQQDNVVNPSFLTVTVQSPFIRLNGSPAVIGEPLVKTKFPLVKLNLLNLPSGGSWPSTVGTSAQILGYFGLVPNSASDSNRESWTYTQGVKGTSGLLSIATLAQVAALNREPNFIELLKAAINAGSLGKAAPSGASGADYPHSDYTYPIDTNIDYQVFQIAANMMDQWDTDSIPTRIFFPDGSATPTGGRTFRGVENLPYFDRMTGSTFPIGTAPSPAVRNINGQSSTITTGTSPSTTLIYEPATSGTVGNAGLAALMITPIIWNPHETTGGVVGVGASLTTDRPTQFRLTAVTADPNGATTTGNTSWKVGCESLSYDDQVCNPNGTPVSPTAYQTVIPPQTPIYTALTESNTELDFSDANGTLFNEPTLLWRPGFPSGSNLTLGPSNRLRSDPVLNGAGSSNGILDLNTNQDFIGILCGTGPIDFGITDSVTHNQYVVKADQLYLLQTGAPDGLPSITFRLEYKDPSSGTWVTYDEHYVSFQTIQVTLSQYVNGDPAWEQQPMYNGALDTGTSPSAPVGPPTKAANGSTLPPSAGAGPAGPIDPRSSRFPNGWRGVGITTALDWDSKQQFFSTIPTLRPDTTGGSYQGILMPGGESGWMPNGVAQMGFYSSPCYSANYIDNNNTNHSLFSPGLFSQNNPLVQSIAKNGTSREPEYYTDADGIARRAMAAYVPNGTSAPASQLVGLPMATANTYPANASGSGSSPITSQIQSRPIILNRAFNSPAEMSYAFRGEPWKNIDFFCPESGDTALLDVFCINAPPANAMVAGKVDLNTRQPKVLAAILSGAYRDAQVNVANPPSSTLPALSTNESTAIASALVARTTNTTQSWEGPLANIGELVGRYVGTGINPPASADDCYTYTNPTTGTGYTYAGLMGKLNATDSIWDNANSSYIQRFREAALRPLVNCGQVRVWNLMIDLVAQTGVYPANSTSLDRFLVQGEKHYWIHLAVDRATGQVIDQQIEEVKE